MIPGTTMALSQLQSDAVKTSDPYLLTFADFLFPFFNDICVPLYAAFLAALYTIAVHHRFLLHS